MRYLPRNIEISFGHAGLTHYGGILFFNEFSRMLQLRRFLTCLQGWTERILRRFHKVNPWRPEATFAKIERLMQTFWRQMLDFRPLLKEKSEIHDGSKSEDLGETLPFDSYGGLTSSGSPLALPVVREEIRDGNEKQRGGASQRDLAWLTAEKGGLVHIASTILRRNPETNTLSGMLDFGSGDCCTPGPGCGESINQDYRVFSSWTTARNPSCRCCCST